MTGRPLAGRSVVVTRSRPQASQLVEHLRELGAEPVELPVIAVSDPPDGRRALAEASRRLLAGDYDWVVVTSTNSAHRLMAECAGDLPPETVKWAAIGPGTALALAAYGITVDVLPEPSVAETLVEDFPGATSGPARVLFPRAARVRPVVASGLAAKGWQVDDVVAYQTTAGDPSPEACRAARQADAVAFTSSSTVERTVKLLGAEGVPPVVVSIGPVTSRAATKAGLRVAAEADPLSIEGLVGAILRALT